MTSIALVASMSENTVATEGSSATQGNMSPNMGDVDTEDAGTAKKVWTIAGTNGNRTGNIGDNNFSSGDANTSFKN
jgi:hypothetical protein